MTLSKILQLSIFGVVIGYVSGKIENWHALQPIYQSELFFYIILVVGTFCVMVTTARLLGTKSWDEGGQRKLFTRRFTVETILMCGFVLALYPLIGGDESNRETSINMIMMLALPIYVLWINLTLKRIRCQLI